jgi:hypothetical protein
MELFFNCCETTLLISLGYCEYIPSGAITTTSLLFHDYMESHMYHVCVQIVISWNPLEVLSLQGRIIRFPYLNYISGFFIFFLIFKHQLPEFSGILIYERMRQWVKVLWSNSISFELSKQGPCFKSGHKFKKKDLMDAQK